MHNRGFMRRFYKPMIQTEFKQEMLRKPKIHQVEIESSIRNNTYMNHYELIVHKIDDPNWWEFALEELSICIEKQVDELVNKAKEYGAIGATSVCIAFEELDDAELFKDWYDSQLVMKILAKASD